MKARRTSCCVRWVRSILGVPTTFPKQRVTWGEYYGETAAPPPSTALTVLVPVTLGISLRERPLTLSFSFESVKVRWCSAYGLLIQDSTSNGTSQKSKLAAFWPKWKFIHIWVQCQKDLEREMGLPSRFTFRPWSRRDLALVRSNPY